jgi:transcription elongation factor SPT5
VVISIEREKIAVLDVSGSVQTISAAQVLQKRDPRQATAEIDAYGIPLHTGDLAESLAGSHERKQGKVLYLYRGNAFLYNKELVESSGVFVVKTRLLASISSTGPRNVIKTMPPPIGRPHGSVDRNFASRRNDPLLHQTIMITGGPFKGYQGIVKSVVDKGYRIELHTNAKIVTVSHSQIMLPGYVKLSLFYTKIMISRQTLGYMGNRPTARIIAGAQTPLVGSKTPNVLSGAQTPKYDGSRTPAWDAGARTPAWDAGARTPRFAQQHSETPSSIMPSETSRHLENASPKGISTSICSLMYNISQLRIIGWLANPRD